MRPFDYVRARTVPDALAAIVTPASRYLAGGTTLLDLMKCGVETPIRLVDLTRIDGLDAIRVDEIGVRLGALATMSAVADHPSIKEGFPAVAQSLTQAASAQLRNMATIGGNLLQKTRCPYYRDPQTFAACNKRHPGSGCAALGGNTHGHAILGASEHCIATYPGDLAVALVALDATLRIQNGQIRTLPLEHFFVEPGDTPHIETQLRPGELILGVDIPAAAVARQSVYLKLRDRSSYEFATASAAVGIELEEDGHTIRALRVAVGGVATRPWRLRALEAALIGEPLDEHRIRELSQLAAEGAHSQGDNAYKIALLPKVVARAILMAGALGVRHE
jgi:xanthine dehydrogenase YagS FAD-binding subunit